MNPQGFRDESRETSPLSNLQEKRNAKGWFLIQEVETQLRSKLFQMGPGFCGSAKPDHWSYSLPAHLYCGAGGPAVSWANSSAEISFWVGFI